MIIKLRELLQKCLFNNGAFCRIDIPIRVMAVEEYARFGTINPLWWRMQYAKVWHYWGKTGQFSLQQIDVQKNRLEIMVSIFKRGATPDNMLLGKNLALKDGSHRLACFIYFDHNEVEVDVEESDYFLPDREDPIIKALYTRCEWNNIQQYKNWLIKEWRLV